jgi:SPRY domain
MSVIGSNIIAGASGTVETGYQIARSLRFNSADSAYLNRTPAVNGNRKTWTLVFWYKRAKIGTDQMILSTPYNTNSDGVRFDSTDKFRLYSNDASNCDVLSARVFRDVGAYAMYMVSVDTTQATAANRVKMYTNNEQITAFTTASYPAQNYDFNINGLIGHNIGRNATSGTQFLDGYITEMRFVDGQALDPTAFGEIDANTGVWNPKTYTGTYGTNGFWLKFDDNSGTTATTLGKDSSGNGNNWTPNNFSVTAGTGNDSLVDSPTNYGTDTGAGGEVRGNYCTYNPLQVMASNPSFSNGNLDVTANAGSWQGAAGSLAVTSGKWYWENTISAVAASTGDVFVGIARADTVFTTANPQNISGTIVYLRSDGHKRIDGTDTTYGATYAANDVIGVALDMDASTVTFYKNNVSQGSISFSSSSLVGKAVLPFNIVITSPTQVVSNFGQRPFAYTAPSGFKALCTQNLPTPAIGASSTTLANKQFDATLYSGTGSALTVTNAGSFRPDLVWYKDRSAASSNALFDAIRGVDKWLTSNGTDAETTISGVSAFNSNGFSLGTNAGGNTSGRSYVAWQWKGGNGTVSNTAGSITSTVSANTTAGVSVVTYTGTGTAGTVGHGLGAAPKLIIFKNRSAAASWIVYHGSISPTNLLTLHNTGAQQNLPAYFNSTAATSSVFSIGSSASTGVDLNTNGSNYIAYVFAEVPGFSKFGSYTGNGSTDGPFVYCGFRPRYVMIKRTDSTSNWSIYDTARDTYNDSSANLLWANLSNAETALARDIDILSNGFKLRSSDTDSNASGTYIFAAFAEAPFNYARAR